MSLDSAHAALAAVRAVHMLACMLLFGEALFACVVAERRALRAGIALGCLLVIFLSAIAWLGLQAIMMSGEPPARAWTMPVIERVVAATQFGHVWLLRMIIVVIAVAMIRRTAPAAVAMIRRTAPAAVAMLVLAGVELAALAWMGHAGAGIGQRRCMELAVDVAHLLGAGAWLGMLPALVAALRAATSAAVRVEVTQRFARIGMLAALAIVATGIANAALRMDALSALFTTDYGHVLIAKVTLVALMLALAAANRWEVTPRLLRENAAARDLRRNAMVEIGLGVVVVMLVGVLGITPPGAVDMPPMRHSMP